MNETNRAVIVLLAGLWIVLMAVLIFLAWAADADVVDRLGDFVEYLDAHRDDPSRLILTLGALVTVVLALLVIIVELAPEEEVRELKVEQAGATTIVPADALRARLEEALVGLPQVTAAKARVMSKDRGLGTALTLTITPDTNVAFITQEASRVVVDTIQSDLGLPVAAPPTVRILFGGPKAAPVASSVVQAPQSPPPAAAGRRARPARADRTRRRPPRPTSSPPGTSSSGARWRRATGRRGSRSPAQAGNACDHLHRDGSGHGGPGAGRPGVLGTAVDEPGALRR